MTDEQNRSTFASRSALHFAKTFFSKLGVTDCEDFVDDKDSRFEMSRDGECKPHVHSARVSLNGGIEKFFDLRKIDNLIELSLDLGARHSENRAIQENVFASGQLRMKASANLQQTRHASRDAHPSLCRFRNPAQDF